ncbi:MAG TPA: DUF4911 domain-containing protein [Desulfobulbus sp.]|nr:DUF4911 domain-containing protein [Desulfobulbus sp.]
MVVIKKICKKNAKKMQKIFLRIAREKIAWFKFVLEGYDGLCVLSTVDRDRGLVSLTYHTSCAAELFGLLTALSPDLSPYWTRPEEAEGK